MKTLLERFEEKFIPVTESGCWIWTAYTNADGYGQINADNRMKKAHRVSWELYNGVIPDSMCICHKCDTPSCVNPNHLFLGTHTENIQDMFLKGRADLKHGSKHGRTELSEEDVISMRKKCNEGTPQQYFADKHGINKGTVSKIILRKTWRHV